MDLGKVKEAYQALRLADELCKDVLAQAKAEAKLSFEELYTLVHLDSDIANSRYIFRDYFHLED